MHPHDLVLNLLNSLGRFLKRNRPNTAPAMRNYLSSFIPNITIIEENESRRESLNDDVLQRNSEFWKPSPFSFVYFKAPLSPCPINII
jgi:hypothetical protein